MKSDANAKGKGRGKEKEKVSVKGKQYTLDKFMAVAKKETLAPQFQDENAENPTFIHDIDTEAAKTWIYPGSNFYWLQLFLFGMLFFFGCFFIHLFG